MGVYNITKDLDDWNIDSSYSIGTIVSYDGKSYKAVKDVPVGINLGFNEYWEKLDTESEIEEIKESISEIEEEIENIDTGYNYSTDEQIVGTWCDGRNVYAKTLILTDNDFNKDDDWYWYYSYIYDLPNNITIINMEGIISYTTDGRNKQTIPIGGYEIDSTSADNEYRVFGVRYDAIGLRSYPTDDIGSKFYLTEITFCQITVKYLKDEDN